MKAAKDLGLTKLFFFVWYSFYTWLIHVSLPPLRVLLLRFVGAHIGRDVVLFRVQFSNAHHHGFSRLIIGDRCFLGDGVSVDLRGGITLYDDVTISDRSMLVSHINVGYKDHPLQQRYPTREAAIEIHKGTYIGSNATILPGVIIGTECIVAAGAVVTKNVPDHTMVAGVPAKVKKRLK